jgi:hypothetical protein
MYNSAGIAWFKICISDYSVVFKIHWPQAVQSIFDIQRNEVLHI